jgi:transposase
MEREGSDQMRLVFMGLGDLVPQDHLLRKIKKVVDFRFIYEKVEHLYAENGRPGVDPVVLFKMLLVGYLYGIPSERKLEEEVTLNIAYRWFLGLELDQRVPDHSTLSQNRRRRFAGTTVFSDIFDGIVEQCIKAGLVTGEALVTDSTHIKANASLERVHKAVVSQTPSEYLLELEEEARKLDEEQRKGRRGQKRGKPPTPKDDGHVVQKSSTDPDAGMLHRPGKPRGFHYLGHVTLDAAHGIILDTFVTPGNVNDHEPYISRLRRIRQRFSLQLRDVAADKGYDFAEVHKGLEDLGLTGYIPHYDRRAGEGTRFSTQAFEYDTQADAYRCPAGSTLRFTHVQTYGILKIYAASVRDCRPCPLREQCIPASQRYRRVKRPIYQDAVDRATERTHLERYYQLQRLRRIWCEGTFATMKDRHCLRRAMRRGIEKVAEQVLLTAAAMNIKRMALAVA